MPKRAITYDEVLNFLERLPYHKFKEVVEHYSLNSKSSFEKDLDMMVTLNFQQRLEKLGINKLCPKCTSKEVVKNGKRASGIQVFQCKNCSTKLTLFTGTILEKTRWLWRIKFINAISSFPMRTLTGVIQIDETFIRERQKGSRHLLSYIDKSDIRKPRYGCRPSKYGVMGPEFATITTSIDNRGYCVCKVSNFGKLTKEIFIDLFEKHLISPAYICSDANDVYESYCKIFDIPHYVKPSNYQTIIYKNGYETPDYSNDVSAKLTKEKNYKVLESLYK